MKKFGDLIKSGDWKGEKHVPVITCPDTVKAGEEFELKVSVGDAIGHPNAFEHYIGWFKVFFLEEGKPIPIELATFTFSAHGELGMFTAPVGKTVVKLPASGTIYALSWCNIHGVWENTKDITVE